MNWLKKLWKNLSSRFRKTETNSLWVDIINGGPPTSITLEIIDYYKKRNLKVPNTWQALGWAHTEIGEVYEILQAMDGGWVRNNPDGKPGWDPTEFSVELGDVIMMLIVAGMTVGQDPLRDLRKKIERKLSALPK